MDAQTYLRRIEYAGPLDPTADTLRALQLAHLQTVPFENLSIHAGEPIILEDAALFEKVVERRRGGFCYELNGLFAALLRTLDFKVDKLSARVANANGLFGPDFDHMTLLVELDQRWLVDVGFGDSFREPLLLDFAGEQSQGEMAYKIMSEESHKLLLQRRGNEEWRKQYRFTLQPHEYPDYAAMCRYHQTSPESHFTRGRVCTRATSDGRITLSEMRLITTAASGAKQERTLTTDEEYANALRKHFGIVMTAMLQLISIVLVLALAGEAAFAQTPRPNPDPNPKPPVTETAAAKYFPNLVLYTQDNRPVHFYNDMLKSRIVLINFMFTTCTSICPPMTANLAKVQKQLGEHVGKDVIMISISVDPLVDTPEVLKKYADRFKAQPGWYFLTGEKKNVDWVLYKLGGYVEDKNSHSSIVIIGNEATGEWMKVHALANPSEIAAAVTKLIPAPQE